MSDRLDTDGADRSCPRVGVPSSPADPPAPARAEHRDQLSLPRALSPFVRWVPYGAVRAPAKAPRREVSDLDGCLLPCSSLRGEHPPPDHPGVPTHLTFLSPVTSPRLPASLPLLPDPQVVRRSVPAQWGHFVERVFAHARLRDLFSGRWLPKDLVRFHTTHKLQLMAHHPRLYRSLGGVAARAGSSPPDVLVRDYRTGFHRALAVPVSRGRHVNALQHALGMLGDGLDGTRRREVRASVDAYAAGDVPLSMPLSLIRHLREVEGASWVTDQTYLAPYPTELATLLAAG